MRRANPEKSCFLQYDKLYIDSKIYVFNDVLGQVVEHSESVRYGDMMSRPGSMMMMGGGGGGGGGFMMSRPSSRTGSRPASGAGGRGDSASSGIPRLPPLNPLLTFGGTTSATFGLYPSQSTLSPIRASNPTVESNHLLIRPKSSQGL